MGAQTRVYKNWDLDLVSKNRTFVPENLRRPHADDVEGQWEGVVNLGIILRIH